MEWTVKMGACRESEGLLMLIENLCTLLFERKADLISFWSLFHIQFQGIFFLRVSFPQSPKAWLECKQLDQQVLVYPGLWLHSSNWKSLTFGKVYTCGTFVNWKRREASFSHMTCMAKTTSWFCVFCEFIWLAVWGGHPLALTRGAGPPSLDAHPVALAGLPAGWESHWVFSALRFCSPCGVGGWGQGTGFVPGCLLQLPFPFVLLLLGVWPSVTMSWPKYPLFQAPFPPFRAVTGSVPASPWKLV